MAQLIRREDIDAVRERTDIEAIVRQRVTLKSAGVGSLKGLCPFHDEKTPSFNVRPALGTWHCFGCGEGGDVISFVQRTDNLSFVEAVEYLADRAGITLHYEGGAPGESGPASREKREQRQNLRMRLLTAHRVAAEYFQKQLATDEGSAARQFLGERGFDPGAAAHFGIGYAPRGWSNLLDELRKQGFSEQELAASGLCSQNQSGRMYDRFRGRVMWPIRSAAGDPIGFGARKLYDDDPGPKYLNTPETIIYKKSQVLYGLAEARKAIAAERRVVVVEGYTDVMAAHLSGVQTAVATCGTAFGPDHVRIVRRLIGDTADSASGMMLASGGTAGGEVIFTFDGDEAGQKAALRAFREDQSFATQTYVAISPEGMDPCDLRLIRGEAEVKALVDSRIPLYRFVIKSAISKLDLSTVEGRVRGMQQAAPIVAQIRDAAIRSEYARELAGFLAMDEADVRRAVRAASRRGEDYLPQTTRPPAQREDPVMRLERQCLEVALQEPQTAALAGFDQLDENSFRQPMHRAVHDAIRAAGGTLQARDDGPRKFLTEVQENALPTLRAVISELVAHPLPADTPEAVERYVREIVRSMLQMQVVRQIADIRGQLGHIPKGSEEGKTLFEKLVRLENQRRSLNHS